MLEVLSMAKMTKSGANKRLQESISKLVAVSNYFRLKGLMTSALEKKFARMFDDLHSLKNKLK